uniref:Uncharacterized protein n=1 Tax=Octopus bimaculoides TaxID=37653 RepID=A0A0L8HYA1_OCTBM
MWKLSSLNMKMLSMVGNVSVVLLRFNPIQIRFIKKRKFIAFEVDCFLTSYK